MVVFWCRLTIAIAVFACPTVCWSADKPTSHTKKNIEGWTVQVDDRLLHGADQDVGERALKLLADRLYVITLVVDKDRLQQLRRFTIHLDRDHGDLTSMQYHPSAAWLKENGYSPELTRCVHIPVAARFANPKHHHQQPWAVLHELAHAYHDQVLGFEDAKVKAAWIRFKESGKYESIPHIDGRMQKHYALTNQMEFFAEMSEAYFGLNDFYPYHRAELKKAEPELYELLKTIWGATP